MSDAWVYILRCADGSLYTGWTVDVQRRLASHLAGGGGRYTRSRLPVEVLASFAMVDASAARREEARIKRLSRAEKLALIERCACGRTHRSSSSILQQSSGGSGRLLSATNDSHRTSSQ
jgi:putative endonuclease